MNYRTAIFILILILSGIIVFQDAFRTYFTHEILSCYLIYYTFADDLHIPECLYSNAFGHFPEYFPLKGGVYRPLLTFSFALDYMIYGLNALGYRITSYLHHVLNAFLVYLLARYFLERRSLALVSAALFFFHPWNSNPIIIIMQRSGLICTGFYVGTVLCFIQYRTRSSSHKKWLLGTLLCAFGTLLSYEMYISLPFVLFALDLLLFRNKRGWYLFHSGMFIALALAILSRFIIFHGIGGYSGTSPHSHHLKVSKEIFSNYHGYLAGFVDQYVPFHQVPEILLILMAVTVVATMFTGEKRYMFLALWVLLAPVPVINVNVCPHYFYLASVGFIILSVGISGRVIYRIFPAKTGAVILGIMLILILAVNTGNIRAEFNQIYTDNLDTRELIELIHKKYPELPEHSRIYMVIPQLIGRDNMGRNYFDISLEHLLQLRYKTRFVRCYPLPVVLQHPKYSDPKFDQPPERTFLLQRKGFELIEFNNLNEIRETTGDKP